jgi:hypothetical protein
MYYTPTHAKGFVFDRCEECREHFLKMSAPLEAADWRTIRSRQQASLWMWQVDTRACRQFSVQSSRFLASFT